jgi:hypothetical protein
VSFDSGTQAGVHARELRHKLAPRPDPLGELRTDLAAVLAVSPVPALERKRTNRISHAIEAARRELRRALEAAGAEPAA